MVIQKAGNEKQASTVQELAQYVRGLTETFKQNMSEEDQKKMDAKTQAKLEAGKQLTSEEMEYLSRTNPVLYQKALRIQKLVQMLEEQLKHAKSKEEADQYIMGTISGISDKDPDKKYIMAAVDRLATEFHRSAAYNRLPNTVKEANQKKNAKEAGDFRKDDSDDEEENGINLKSWTPLQEVIDSLPTFTADA